MTLFTTIFAGVSVFVIRQIFLKRMIEPIQELRKIKAEVLFYLANDNSIIHNAHTFDKEEMQQIHSLKEFLDSYGPSLAKRVNDELEVIHDPLNDEQSDMDQILTGLNKKPFAVQKEVIKAVVKSFKTGNRSVYITAEMGSGKTLMGIASALLLKKTPRVLELESMFGVDFGEKGDRGLDLVYFAIWSDLLKMVHVCIAFANTK